MNIEHHSGNYSCCTISLLQSPECIKVQHFEGQRQNFFWDPRPHSHWRGVYPPQTPSCRRGASIRVSSVFDARPPPLQFLTSLRLCSPQAQALRASSLARPRNIDFVPTPLGICSSLCMSIGAAAPLRGTEHFFGQSLNFLFSSQQPKIQKICI